MSSEQLTETKRWLITIAVMLVAVMEVLDMTIVNVALPNMMGTLSATTDQITWVLTSYIVAAAVTMPLTGFLIRRFGCKRILLLNIAGFLFSSALCGIANSLPEIVVFRVLQGIFGAGLVPMSQFILRNTFPPEQVTKAMAIWGVGIMAGPVCGPTLGGYITDIFNWRWIFYINIPVCILAFFMCTRLIEETRKEYIKVDWTGLFLMATGIGCLQVFLDRGNSVGWFEATSIRWLFIISVTSLTLFIARGIKRHSNNIINLHLFANRNFAVGCLLLAIFCASFFGTIALQPLLMENLMNYPTALAGLVMAPRGIASAMAMACVPKLIKKFDARFVLGTGIFLAGIGTYATTQFTLDISPFSFVWTGLVQGFGIGLFFVPLSSLTFATLSQSEYAEASGLFSFWRSFGQSVGISLLSTLLTRENQINWNVLGVHIQPFNPAFQHWLSYHRLDLHNPFTLQQLAHQLSQQAGMISFLDAFHVASFALFCMLPLVFLMKKPKKPTGNAMMGH